MIKNDFKIRGDTTEIYIKSKGVVYTMLIDTEDLNILKNFKSTISLDKDKYAILRKQVNCKRTNYRLHRLINNCPDGLDVDHINRNKLDNRKRNLRNVTKSDNSYNKVVGNVFGTRGITYNKRDKIWRVTLGIKGKQIQKYFKDKQRAVNYRKMLEKKYKRDAILA